MEPITKTSHLPLTRTVTLELLDDEGGTKPVPAELSYDRNDPFAVSLLIGDADHSVTWTCSRELISEGLHEPRGDGDVHVWPCLNEKGHAIVLIELSSPDGGALLQANPREIMNFLTMSHCVIAPGEESAHIDVDAVIEAILAAEQPNPGV
ncbi:MAG TPA: SsgA family sporulation/cell division regulator [Nocardioidaceae bacterium]|nr:SsgA family sporulation/cell division regulator [Nocardioidaceae bacterium]